MTAMHDALREAVLKAGYSLERRVRTEGFISDEELEQMVGLVTGEHIWHRFAMMGSPLIDDEAYYSEAVVQVELVSLDSPPKEVGT